MLKKLLINLILLGIGGISYAQISTDAGITPPQDRWIFRVQYRINGTEANGLKNKSQIIPLVLGYGINSNLSILAKVSYIKNTNSSGNTIQQGFNNFYLLLKVKLIRKNTLNYSLGIAPFIASSLPINKTTFNQSVFKPELGINISYRPKYSSLDISSYYTFFYPSKSKELNSAFNIDIAYSRKVPLSSDYSQLISPVLELNYLKQFGSDKSVQRASLLFLSPGITYVNSALVFEALYQVPVNQNDDLIKDKERSRLILGIKYLF